VSSRIGASGSMVAYAERRRLEGRNEQCAGTTTVKPTSDSWNRGGLQFGQAWRTEPDVGRVAHGVAAGMDRLRCIGNGQVPGVAAMAWRILSMPNAAGEVRRNAVTSTGLLGLTGREAVERRKLNQ
jgi:hypothetical protein